MARTDRAYRKMMRRKTMLCAEKDYRDILLRDCQEQARKKTDAYRTQLMRELYAAHPDWIPAEEAGKIVFDSRMAQFDADMAFVRKQASTRAAKAISKDPACAEREEEKLQQLQKEHEELRNQYSSRLQQEISAQLTDMSGDGAEREAAVSDIERKVDAFRAEQEKAAQKQMETIRQAEDSKIRKLSDALEKLQIAPADRPGLPEGVVLRVQDLCMYFGGVHNVNVVTSYVNASATTLGAFVDSGAITDSRMVYCTAWLDVTTEAGMADYTTFYTAMSAWELANGESGSTYALNSYAMAGYIAGSIFVQALQAVDKAGLELNYANFAKIMEETEFSIPMGGTISYAGGDRLGVTALALNCVSLSKNDAGVYALTPVSPILSLADVVAAIK